MKQARKPSILSASSLSTEQWSVEGIESIIQGSVMVARSGALLGQPSGVVYLAEAHLISGRAEEGLQALAEKIPLLRDHGGAWGAEVLRVNGELLVSAGGNEIEAEKAFNQALGVARKQGAKSLELRSVMGMARLWQKQSKPTEARQLLSEIYGWFTEGFIPPT
jgi:predicted ATPase